MQFSLTLYVLDLVKCNNYFVCVLTINEQIIAGIAKSNDGGEHMLNTTHEIEHNR